MYLYVRLVFATVAVVVHVDYRKKALFFVGYHPLVLSHYYHIPFGMFGEYFVNLKMCVCYPSPYLSSLKLMYDLSFAATQMQDNHDLQKKKKRKQI